MLNVQGSKSLWWSTGIDTKGLKAGAAKSKGILAGLTHSISKMDVFAALSVSAAIAFKKITKQAYSFSKDLKAALAEVSTISSYLRNNFDKVENEILQLSKTVPDNANKLTKALYQIVSAGYDGAEAMKILRVSSKLATAGLTDTFTVADALTSIMNAYGDRAGTAERITDKLFTTVKLGKIKMEQLASNLSQVTGLAAQAGVSFDDLVASVAKGTKTIKPEIFIHSMRSFLTSVIKEPAEDAKEIIENLDLDFGIEALKKRGLADFMENLQEKTQGNIKTLQKLFPNIRGLQAFLAAATVEGGKFSDVLDEIKNSTGAANDAFKIMVEEQDNQMKILQNNINAKLKPLGDWILGIANKTAKTLNEMFSSSAEGYKNLTEEALGEGYALKANFDTLTRETLMLAKKQEKNNFELNRYKELIKTINTDYKPYLDNLIDEKDSYADIAQNLSDAKTKLEDYWEARRKQAVTKDIQAEMDKLNKRNQLLEYMIDLKKSGAVVAIPEFTQYATSEADAWNKVNEEIENNKQQLKGLENQYKHAVGAIDSTDKVILTLIEKTNKNTEETTENLKDGVFYANKLNEYFYDGSGLAERLNYNLKEVPQTLSDMTSVFGESIKELEDLRQAGVDTTDLLKEKWADWVENIKTEYGKDHAYYKAAVNMKKDADQEYFEWKKQKWQEDNEFQNAILQTSLGAYKNFANSLLDTDMTGQERREMIWNQMKQQFVSMIVDMTAKWIESKIVQSLISKSAQTEAVVMSQITGASIASAYAPAATLASLASFGANAAPAQAGMLSTFSLSKALSGFITGKNEGGEIETGSNINKDSVLTALTKGEFVINRESAQANKDILIALNQDKNYLSNIMKRNTGGAVSLKEPIISPRISAPNNINFKTNTLEGKLDILTNAVKAQTLNQVGKSPVINIRSKMNMEDFIVEFDKTRKKMKSRGYSNE